MMKYDKSNLLVVRRTERTLKDSCWTDLKWATNRLGCERLWRFKINPLEAVYLPTGQKILFRGLDDPLKVTSITVDYGYLCWAWLKCRVTLNLFNCWNTLTLRRGQSAAKLFSFLF